MPFGVRSVHMPPAPFESCGQWCVSVAGLPQMTHNAPSSLAYLCVLSLAVYLALMCGFP